jgi:Ribonuclease G/E
VAALAGDTLIDFRVERPAALRVGDVLQGRLTARMPALAGSFVSLGPAGDGFLTDSGGGTDLSEGSAVMVRVVRAPQGGKGPRLEVANDALRRGPDAVQSLATLHPGAGVGVDDPELLAALRPMLGDRLRMTVPAFDDTLLDRIAALEQPDVALPGGARLRIEPTAALTAIDVDLGGASATRAGKQTAHQDANRRMLPLLAAEIRLRNLGGAILVDFAGLSPRRRAALGPALQTALDGDPLHPRLLGFTALGLAEIVRPRREAPLHELLRGPAAAAAAALRALARAQAADPAHPPTLHAGAAVATAIQALPRGTAVRIDRDLPPLAWHVEQL